jgi:hypothetical protein
VEKVKHGLKVIHMIISMMIPIIPIIIATNTHMITPTNTIMITNMNTIMAKALLMPMRQG